MPLGLTLRFALTTPATEYVVPRISQGIPLSCPVKILAMASSCSSVMFSGTMKTTLPLPSWIALGQSITAAQVIPDRSTSPHLPSAMTQPTNALQLPSDELGKPARFHGQPGSQVQNSLPAPFQSHYPPLAPPAPLT